MTHILPPLPYPLDGLEPYISRETLEFHYGKHHKTYVSNLNKLIFNTEFFDLTLEEIIRKSSGAIFNNAAQVWNHTFYWNGLSCEPTEQKESKLSSSKLLKKIVDKWETLENFKNDFGASAISNFGSGWTWLVKKTDESLEILNTMNAQTPITTSDKPILTCDVWEHAYYIDYRNARPKYLESFWELINWEFAENNFTE